MKQNIENIIAENSVETTNKEYGNGIFISTDAISDIAQDIVKLFSIPVVGVPKGTYCELYKDKCMKNICSVTPYWEKCHHLK